VEMAAQVLVRSNQVAHVVAIHPCVHAQEEVPCVEMELWKVANNVMMEIQFLEMGAQVLAR